MVSNQYAACYINFNARNVHCSNCIKMNEKITRSTFAKVIHIVKRLQFQTVHTKKRLLSSLAKLTSEKFNNRRISQKFVGKATHCCEKIANGYFDLLF